MKKSKRLLALLLTVLLIAGMVPLSASAASPTLTVGLSVGTAPAGMATANNATQVWNLVKDTDAMASATTVAEKAAVVNGMYTPIAGKGTQSAPYEVPKNEPFYLGIDMSYGSPDQGGIIQGSGVAVEFPRGVFELANSTATRNAKMNPILDNRICSSDDLDGMSSNADFEPYRNYWSGRPAFTVNSVEWADTHSADGTETNRARVTLSGAGGFIPNGASWDVLLTLKATGSTGTYEIKAPTDNADTNTHDSGSGIYNSIGANNSGWQGPEDYSSNVGDAVDGVSNDISSIDLTDTNQFSSNSIWIKVVSNEPTVSIPANTVKAKATGRTLAVTMTNGTFANNTTTNYEIVKSDDASKKITVDSVDVNGATATLHFDASSATVGETYKVVVKKAAITSTGDELSGTETETGTFKICANLADVTGASITNTANAAATGTLTYGDTLSVYKGANWPADAGTLTQKWTANGATMANNSASIDTSINAMAVAAGMDTDNPYVITCTVTSAALDNTSIEISTAAGLAKKQLSFNTNASVTLDSVLQNATTGLSKTKPYTFVTADGLVGSDAVTIDVTGEYQSTSTKGDVTIPAANVTVASDLAGDQAKRYIAPTSGKPTVKGSVKGIGYALVVKEDTPDIAFVNNDGGAGFTDDTVMTGGITVKGTVDLGTDKVLKSVKVTKSAGATGADTATVTDAENGIFTYVLPTAAPQDTYTYTFEAVQGDPKLTLVPVVADKAYDGTTAATVKYIASSTDLTKAYDGDIDISNIKITAAFVSAEPNANGDGTAQAVTINGAPASNDDYDFTSTGITAKITKAAVGTITATGAQIDPKNASIDSVVAAVKAADVMVEGVTGAQGTVGDYITADADIKTAIQTALGDGYTAPASANYTVNDADDTAALASTTITTLVEGDTYTFANGDTPTFKDDAGNAIDDPSTVGFTVTTDENGVTTVVVGAGAVTGGTKISATAGDITFGSAGTDIPPTAKVEAVAEKYDFSGLAGKNLALTLNLGTIASGALKDHFTDADNKTVAVTVPVKRTASAGNFGVTFDDKGYGKASEGFLEVDSTGKITALPTVTDVVLGAEFIGWSTNGDDKHIVDIDEYTVKEDITLTAVYRGYMAGYEDSTAKPERKVTRAELARMLVVASGKYDGSKDYGKPSYKDAQTGWYVPFVACAEDLGILHGYPDGTVKPNNPVTREEASLMIANAFGVTVKDGATTDKVNDFDKVGSWAQKYVATLCDNGTINGYPDGTFRATRSITRAEAAQMINIYLGLTKEDKDAIKADTTIKSSFPDVTANYWGYENIMFASLSVPATYYTTEITIPEAK